jgi:hypothetical protein
MIFYCEDPHSSLAEMLDEVSFKTGLTPAQINTLIDCELDTEFLLQYLTAILSNRIN